ncbi:MAG TPA: hypothetical protein V6D17_21325 [Candidatus Obscuribacterales bacterium]
MINRSVESQWLLVFSLVQSLFIVWLIIAQICAGAIQQHDILSQRYLIALGSLACMALICWLSLPAGSRRRRYILSVIEAGLIAAAWGTVTISGIELLALIFLVKTALWMDSSLHRAMLATTVLLCIVLTTINPQAIFQGSERSGGLNASRLIFGTDLLSFAAIIGITGVLSTSLLREKEHKQGAELLAGKLDELAAEIERSRVAHTINTSVVAKLEEIQRQLIAAWQSRKEDKDVIESLLAPAKELTAVSMSEIRAALVMLRRKENNAAHATEPANAEKVQ